MAKRKSPTRKPFEQLTITDNYMFQAVMRDTKRVKPLLEMVLGKKIRKIEFVEIEKTVENGYDSRGIRMDIYVEDDENMVYDVEMQASKKRHLGRRFRFYQGSIDMNIIKKGRDFGKLKKSYIIFITTYDPFGRGWYIYPFDMLCKWDPSLSMNTGSEFKLDEERRLAYMSYYADAADMKELGDYRTYVRSVRDSAFSDDILTAVLKIALTTIQNIRSVINAHPDWDDEDVAEEVLTMEDDD